MSNTANGFTVSQNTLVTPGEKESNLGTDFDTASNVAKATNGTLTVSKRTTLYHDTVSGFPRYKVDVTESYYVSY